jgi:hypothetical protein
MTTIERKTTLRKIHLFAVLLFFFILEESRIGTIVVLVENGEVSEG